MNKTKPKLVISVVEPKKSWTTIILTGICIGLFVIGLVSKSLHDSTKELIYFRIFQISIISIMIPVFILTLRKYFIHPFKKIGELIFYKTEVVFKIYNEVKELKGLTASNFDINTYWGEGHHIISSGIENYFIYNDEKGYYKFNIFIRSSKIMKILKRCIAELNIDK